MRELLAVRREPRIPPVGYSLARSTDVLPSRVIQSMGFADAVCHRAWHVRQRAVRGHGHLRAARTRGRHEPLDRRDGRADRLEADRIEGHREERALLHVEEMPASRSPRVGEASPLGT